MSFYDEPSSHSAAFSRFPVLFDHYSLGKKSKIEITIVITGIITVTISVIIVAAFYSWILFLRNKELIALWQRMQAAIDVPVCVCVTCLWLDSFARSLCIPPLKAKFSIPTAKPVADDNRISWPMTHSLGQTNERTKRSLFCSCIGPFACLFA